MYMYSFPLSPIGYLTENQITTLWHDLKPWVLNWTEEVDRSVINRALIRNGNLRTDIPPLPEHDAQFSAKCAEYKEAWDKAKPTLKFYDKEMPYIVTEKIK